MSNPSQMAVALVDTLAGMQEYTWAEGESWTDDQAEDAIVTLNRLIEDAQNIMRRVRT